MELQLHSYSTVVLDGVHWLASRRCHFTLFKRATSALWKAGWVGPRASLDGMKKNESSAPCRQSSRDSLVVHPVAQSLYRLHYPTSWHYFRMFRCVRRIAKNDCRLRHVCPFVCLYVCLRMEELCSHWTNFHEVWHLRIFRKSSEKI